jgi:hypothetical protein
LLATPKERSWRYRWRYRWRYCPKIGVR